MTRARRGLDFEAALKRWVDPAVYRALTDDGRGQIRSEIEVFYLKRGVDLWAFSQIHSRRHLESLIFGQLAQGALLSSAIDDASDPSHPRVLVHPALYDSNDVSYDQNRRTVTAAGRTLRNVEVFEPSEIPTNVTRLPEWLSQYSDQPPMTAPEPLGSSDEPGALQHSPDYSHVTLRSREFHLTPTQARIVRVLHEASRDGSGWRHIDEIRNAVAFEAKIPDLFRRLQGWRELIEHKPSGRYRLNL